MDILFLAAIAVFILYRMFFVMGASDEDTIRHFKEKRRKALDQAYPVPGAPGAHGMKEVNPEAKEAPPLYSQDADPSVVAVIMLLQPQQPNFSEAFFLEGAQNAFEMIIQAFSQGNKATLKELLTPPVYHEFCATIDAREAANAYPDTTLLRIKETKLLRGQVFKHAVALSVKFISEQVTLMRDRNRTVLSGDPSYIETSEDIWTFEHALNTGAEEWRLSGTSHVQ